jgi:hypothetical protein
MAHVDSVKVQNVIENCQPTNTYSVSVWRCTVRPFAELWKVTIKFFTSVCPSLRMEQLGSKYTNFHEICYLSMFWIFCQKICSHYTWQEWREPYIKTYVHLWSYLAEFFIEWSMLQTKVVEKIKTHIVCSKTLFFFKLCRLRDDVGKYGRVRQAIDDNIMLSMYTACWIPKATNAHSEYVTHCFFHSKQWSRKRSTMLRHTYIAWLVISLHWQFELLKISQY